MLGTARSNHTHMRHVSREKDQGTYTPKSVVTISVDGSLVRKRMFSGLFTSHALDLSEDLEANDKGEGQHT